MFISEITSIICNYIYKGPNPTLDHLIAQKKIKLVRLNFCNTNYIYN